MQDPKECLEKLDLLAQGGSTAKADPREPTVARAWRETLVDLAPLVSTDGEVIRETGDTRDLQDLQDSRLIL